MGVVLREQAEGDGGDGVVAPALVQAQEQVTALLLTEHCTYSCAVELFKTKSLLGVI